MMIRVFLLVIDQLAGHWAENVKVMDDVPPVNIWDYAMLGYIPNFRRLIEEGIFCFAWNMGICDTTHAMKYLATGRYNADPYWTSRGGWSYYPRTEDNPGPIGLFEFAQHYDPDRIHPACFTTDHWIAPGYFYTAGYPIALSAYHPDDEVWHKFAKPYLNSHEKWNLIYVYFPVMDAVSHCPSYRRVNPHVRSSKHSYMLHLDSLLGDVIDFLKVKGFWNDTFLILASDHGYHAACTVAHNMGVKTANWCCDHPAPYDCEVWDFENDRSTGQYSGGPRRTLFMISGGALDEEFRGRILRRAEIIDVAATISDIIDIPYKCEGTSIFEKKNEMINITDLKSQEAT